MYRKYRIVESIASSVSQYESYHDQVYRYTPSILTEDLMLGRKWQVIGVHLERLGDIGLKWQA